MVDRVLLSRVRAASLRTALSPLSLARSLSPRRPPGLLMLSGQFASRENAVVAELCGRNCIAIGGHAYGPSGMSQFLRRAAEELTTNFLLIFTGTNSGELRSRT